MEATASARSRLPELAKYEVLGEIGHGGMATVYRAVDKRLGREVAVKVIHPHLRDSPEVVSRFNTEARAVAKLRHPNIVEVFDVSEAGEVDLYLVAEIIEGTTLRKLLQSRKAMPPEVAAAFALELLAALEHANGAGVVHRDIKPENVLIDHRPCSTPTATESLIPSSGGKKDRVVVKLTDFGIAKLLDAQGVTSTGQVLGSPAHMAPEQIEGGEVDVRADVFGMGVLLYECMVGHLPFEGNNPAQVLRRVLEGSYAEAVAERPIVGSRWSALLDRALAHNPEDRWATAAAMREAVSLELERLGVAQPKRALEAWLDDADAEEKAHAARMIEKLCALGSEARKKGDVLEAAADYNRALAHAPDDPQLLRIVAGYNRAEARGRWLRRAGGAFVVMTGMGLAAFGVGRLLQSHPIKGLGPDTSAQAAITARPPPSALSGATSASAGVPAAVSPIVHPAPPVFAPRPITERSVHVDVSPAMGVRVTIDGADTRNVSSGDSLRLDSKAHSLAFTCPVCNSVTRDIAASERDEAIAVRVPIKPASLVIMGAQDKTYQIVEHPEISVRIGANTVGLTSAFERVTVKQIETGTSVQIRLEAGKAGQATF